jgi:hypothetical protein
MAARVPANRKSAAENTAPSGFVIELQAAVTHLQAHPAKKPLVGGLADKTMGV